MLDRGMRGSGEWGIENVFSLRDRWSYGTRYDKGVCEEDGDEVEFNFKGRMVLWNQGMVKRKW